MTYYPMISRVATQFSELPKTVKRAIYDAGSFIGFLKIINWLRFGTVLALIARFSVGTPSLLSARVLEVAILVYFFVTLALLFLTDFKPQWFDKWYVIYIEIFSDILFITFFYLSSGQTDSDIYQLFFLPLIVLIRYFGNRKIIVLTVFLILSIGILSSVLDVNSRSINMTRFLVLTFFPRVSFLGISLLFYIIYQRRRGLFGRLDFGGDELLDQLQAIVPATFSVDKELRITAISSQFEEKFGKSILFRPYYALLPVQIRSRPCPITAAINSGNQKSANLKFIGLDNDQHDVRLEINPVRSGKGRSIIGANVLVTSIKSIQEFRGSLREYASSVDEWIEKNNRQYQQVAREKAQQLEAVLKSVAAVLDSDKPAAAQTILSAMAELFECKYCDARVFDDRIGRQGLWLEDHYGYSAEEAQDWKCLPLDADSLVINAYRNGSIVYSDKILGEENSLHFMKRVRMHGLRAMVCFPLKIDNKTIGTVSLYRTRRQPFSEEERRLGQSIANTLAVATSNKRLINRINEQAKRQGANIAAVVEFSQDLAAEQNLQQVIQRITQLAQDRLKAETAALFLLNDDTLYREAIVGLPDDWYIEEAYKRGEGVTGQVIPNDEGQTKIEPIVINTIDHNDRIKKNCLEKYQEALPSKLVKQILIVPLVGPSGAFGALRVVNKLNADGTVDVNGFDSEDANLLSIISASSSVAIEGIKQSNVQQLRQNISELGAYYQSQSSSVGELLQECLGMLVTELDAEVGVVAIPMGDNLRFEYAIGDAEISKAFKGTIIPIDDSILGDVYLTNRAEAVADAQSDQRYYEEIVKQTKRPIRSMIAVPIVGRDGRTIAVLNIINKRRGRFVDDDLNMFQPVAEWIGTQTTIIDFVEELRQLNDWVGKIAKPSTLAETCEAIAEGAVSLLKCDIAGIGLYQQATREIRAIPGGYWGETISAKDVEKLRFSIYETGGDVLRLKKICTSSDTMHDPNSIFGSELASLIEARGIVAAPLYVGGWDVGILYAATHESHEFSKSQQRLLMNFASQAATAIRNVELLEETRRKAELQKLFNKIGLVAERTFDLEKIINIILTGVTGGYGLRFNRAAVFLMNEEGNCLDGYAAIGQLTNEEAEEIWKQAQISLDNYVEEVLNNEIPVETTLQHKVKEIAIPIFHKENDPFVGMMAAAASCIVDSDKSPEVLKSSIAKIMLADRYAFAPLVSGSKVLGFILADKQFCDDEVTMNDVELLQFCAGQAASAVERVKAHQALQNRIEMLDELRHVGVQLSHLTNLKPTLNEIAQSAKHLFKADVVAIALCNAEEEVLDSDYAFVEGASKDELGNMEIRDNGLTKKTINAEEAVTVVKDFEQEPYLASDFVRQRKLRSVATARLEFKGEGIGILYVNYAEPNRVTKDIIDGLKLFALQASAAIYSVRLFGKLQEAVKQRERDQLRQDLHDALNSFQFLIKLRVEKLKRKLDQEEVTEQDIDKCKPEMADLLRSSQRIYSQLDNILRDMRDEILTERGIQGAFEEHCNNLVPLDIELNFRGDIEARFSADVELALFRIMQEAINNTNKHANLDKVNGPSVSILLDADANPPVLSIRDNGCGFDINHIDKHKRMGLRSIENWANKIQAATDIRSTVGKGTCVHIHIQKTGGKI